MEGGKEARSLAIASMGIEKSFLRCLDPFSLDDDDVLGPFGPLTTTDHWTLSVVGNHDAHKSPPPVFLQSDIRYDHDIRSQRQIKTFVHLPSWASHAQSSCRSRQECRMQHGRICGTHATR